MAVLLEKAMNGAISIIVGMKLDRPWVPEGFLSLAAVTRQRAAISAAESRLKARYEDKKLEIRSLSPLPYVSFMADVGLLLRLDLDDAVASIELNGSGSGGLRESVPLVNAPSAWASGYTGAGQTIAILDSGVDKNHPFLSGKVVAEACFSTPVSGSTLCPSGQSPMSGAGAGVNCSVAISGCDHGTHVAGIAAGSSNADAIWGVAKNANVISIQVMRRVNDPVECDDVPAPCARYLFFDLANALSHVASLATQFTIAAVNMSLKSNFFYATRVECRDADPLLRDAVANVRSVGTAVVGITGNEGIKNRLVLPGCIPGVIDVGASTKDDTVWADSNSTSEFDLLAPGNGNAAHPLITSSVPLGASGYPYTGFLGTSMAAPHVAGALAILRQKSPLASHDILLQDLATTGVFLTDPINQVTKPRINVFAALSADQTPPTPPGSLIATAASPTSVSLSWSAAADEHGVHHYSVQRRSSLTTSVFAEIGTAVSSPFTDPTVVGGTTYQYQIQAVDTSGNLSAASNRDLATTVVYSDDPLVAQTSSIRRVHIEEPRNAINSIRAFTGLSAATWTDPALAGFVVKAIHLQELRDRLGEALTIIGATPAPYTDPTLTPAITVVKAVHVDEIRRNAR